MTNDPRGNSIISNAILPNGQLGLSKSFRTGGFGGYLFNQRNRSGEQDALGTQNALIVNDDVLFGVNAGTNSVSIFLINRNQPTELTFVSSIPSGGHFPVALAFSRKLQMLCVVNGGEKNGVQCYSFLRDKSGGPYLVPLPHVSRSLGLTLTTPPLAYPSVSDLIFTPDSSQLLVAVKENINTGSRGFILSFHVEQGQIGNPVRNQPYGSVSPFGMIIVPGTGITSDPILVYADNRGGGFGIAKLSGTGVLQASVTTIIPGQIDTCWTVFSPRSGHLFTTDTTANVVTESALDVNSLTAHIVNQYSIHGAPLDAVVASLRNEDVLYILTPGLPGVHVMSLAVPGHAQLVQQYSPARETLEFPLNTGAQGIAIYLIH